MKTTLDRFGRIVIPKAIRKDLGIKAGRELSVEQHGEAILVRPVQEAQAITVKEGILVYRGTIEGDITKAVEAHRAERLRRLSRRIAR